MIVDLSSPQGASINDGISSEVASLQYTSIDHLAALVSSRRKGLLFSKGRHTRSIQDGTGSSGRPTFVGR